MRAKIAAAFAMGFAVGAMLLVAALWWSGSLNTSRVFAGSRQALPGSPRQSLPLKASPPPAAPTGNTSPAAEGTAPPHLAMPIAGINPADVQDTFNDMREGRKHEALDILAPRGTPVQAVAEGNVVKLFTSKEGGLTVYQFDDSQTYCYYYAHLERYATGLKEGTLLRKGDVLGYVGSTGNASPETPHLHFAVNLLGPDKKWWEGSPIDPLPLLR